MNLDRPYFGSDDEINVTIVHEFVHPFIMRYCTKYRNKIEQYSELYEKNENVYKNNGCPEWFSAINEELTRTVEIIINSGGDEEKAFKVIEEHKKSGFICIPVLYQAFNKYYSKKLREKISFDNAFLDIINSLDSLYLNP